jgi:hypothetical protein|tara:strand:+ start:298 stop:1113 length:816 start_codon:yes stop_codon:yes gene_type:complete
MKEQIKFFTSSEYSGLVPEPIPTYKQFPEWYSKLETTRGKWHRKEGAPSLLHSEKLNRNAKGCPGITDFLKQGYLIPAWCDMVVRKTPQNKYVVQQVYDSHLPIDLRGQEMKVHSPDQFSTIPERDLPHSGGEWLKMFAPWIIKTSPGVSILITNPIWHRDTRFTTATGVFHSDSTPFLTNWMFEWNVDIPTRFTEPNNIDEDLQIIREGTPLMQIIPFKRQKYNSSIEYISNQEIDHMRSQFLRNTHNSKPSRCPYTRFRSSINKLFHFK